MFLAESLIDDEYCLLLYVNWVSDMASHLLTIAIRIAISDLLCGRSKGAQDLSATRGE